MVREREQTRRVELDDFIEAFEAAQARDGQADPADFLPAPDHPLHRAVLRELVRVDLEYGWERGRPRTLQEYQRFFPELSHDAAAIEAIAFEEYRLRRQAGEHPSSAEYEKLYGIDTGHWPGPHVHADRSRRGQASTAHPSRTRGLTGTHPGMPDLADLQDCAASFRVDVAHLGPQGDVQPSKPEATSSLTRALTALPEPGSSLAGFHLVTELGRGSFGRVYLARQGDLADRLVALKVSLDLSSESQTLARLQHTNIVPIYSVHPAGRFQAVCMPYFGSTTLGHVLQEIRQEKALPVSGSSLVETLRKQQEKLTDLATICTADGDSMAVRQKLARMTYVQAVLWLAARLADGLAHAHERGILHRDLKPANILLTDEGQPMLLDFNLSADAEPRGPASAARMGGTLPYMAPEHLDAFLGGRGAVDARSDLYALGVILYELLTGRLPAEVHTGPLREVLPRMIADRRRPVPSLRRWNWAVSPAVESILRHCLEPEPSRRYQSAHELREDLQRQMDHLPLRHAPEPSLRERVRKWGRRHPRLASPGGLGGVAAILVTVAMVPAAWLIWQEGQHDKEARRRADEQTQIVTQEKRQEAEKAVRATEQEQLANDAAKRAGQAKQRVTDALEQFHAFQSDNARLAVLEDVLSRVELLPEPSAVDQEELGRDLVVAQDALARYQITTRQDWQELPAVLHLPAEERARLREDIGTLLYLLARAELRCVAGAAERCRSFDRLRPALGWQQPAAFAWNSYAVAVAVRIRSALRLNRLAATAFPSDRLPRSLLTQEAALRRLLGQKAAAERLGDKAEKRPFRDAHDRVWSAFELAARGCFRKAVPLLREASRQAPQNASAWLLLGLCQQNLGDDAEAAASYSTYLALQPHALRGYVCRATVYLRLGKPALAKADAETVLHEQPGWADAYVQRAAAWEGLGRQTEAIDDLSTALKLQPSLIDIHYLRAEWRKRLKDTAGAERDLELVRHSEPKTPEGWAYRGLSWSVVNPEAAVADFDRALNLNPRCLLALRHKARLLATVLNRPAEAKLVLDEAIKNYPDYGEDLLQRAFLHVRLRDRGAAHEDAEQALRKETTPAMHYLAAGIYALTYAENPEDRSRALQLLGDALRAGYGFDRLENDLAFKCLYGDPVFTAFLVSARVLGNRGSPRSP